MTTIPVPATTREQRPPLTWSRLQTRFRLLLLGAAAVVLALITMAQAINAYTTSYELFRGIAEVNSTTVDASERALQYIAQASQAAADYTVLTSDTPLYEQAQTDIFRNFASFRDEMAILRGNLQSDAERTAYTVAETFTFSRFWRHVSDLVAQRSNDAVARQQYLAADNHVRNWINPALQSLENLNFAQMEQAGADAGGIITSQVILLGIPALALALLVTYLSMMLRQKVHRYLTPGIDLALVLSWLLLLVMVINLLGMPNQLNVMIQDAYRSVSGSSRVLVDANLANRAESSELLDTERAQSWDARFDEAGALVELRICGAAGCLGQTFISGASDQPNAQAVRAAQNISSENSARIAGIIPLVANITFAGETAALERARTAFIDYLAVNAALRSQIASGDISGAVELNTSTEPGASQEAFDRFANAMEQVRTVNRKVFDDVWGSASASLQTNRVLFGLAGYTLIGFLIVFGVYHRYREL
ncbi:MAG: hypothetical protein ABI835_12200 [Chloroflexota bacterium]